MARRTKTDIARDYIKAHGKYKDGSDVPDRTLAKKMREELPEEFKSIENARSMIREARGHNGVYKRQHVKPEQFTPVHGGSNPKRVKQDDQINARVLILDIETAPIRAFVWSLWKQTVAINQIQNDWFCLTWSAKWLFEPKIISDRLTGKEAIKQDDKRIMKSLWAIIEEADIVIAHNGDQFDIPAINTRFLVHGMKPPTPYQTIDTLKTLKKQFRFSSNKLDHVNRILSLRRKMDTGGFELWDQCYRGEEAALKKMESYNIHDVRILEETYLALRPWIKPHPQMSLFILDDVERCPTCGSGDLKFEGTYRTYANNFQACRCNNCGAVGRRRLSDNTITQRRKLLYSTPK